MRHAILAPAVLGTTHPTGIAAALTGGAYLSLAQLPLSSRAEVTANMEARIAAAPREFATAIVNAWSGESVRSLEGRYRCVLMGDRVAQKLSPILPPTVPEMNDAFEVAHRHLSWQPRAQRPLDRYGEIVRQVFDVLVTAHSVSAADQLWSATSLHERQTLLNLLFGGLVYLKVSKVAGERILDLAGRYGSPIELGLGVGIDAQDQLQYILCRGDPNQVITRDRSVMLEHIHPLRPLDPSTGGIYDADEGLVPLDMSKGSLMTDATTAMTSVADLVATSDLFTKWPRRRVAELIAARIWPEAVVRHRVLHPAGGVLVQYHRWDRTIDLACADNPAWRSDASIVQAQRDARKWSIRPRGRHVRFLKATYDDVLARRFDQVFPAQT